MGRGPVRLHRATAHFGVLQVVGGGGVARSCSRARDDRKLSDQHK